MKIKNKSNYLMKIKNKSNYLWLQKNNNKNKIYLNKNIFLKKKYLYKHINKNKIFPYKNIFLKKKKHKNWWLKLKIKKKKKKHKKKLRIFKKHIFYNKILYGLYQKTKYNKIQIKYLYKKIKNISLKKKIIKKLPLYYYYKNTFFKKYTWPKSCLRKKNFTFFRKPKVVRVNVKYYKLFKLASIKRQFNRINSLNKKLIKYWTHEWLSTRKMFSKNHKFTKNYKLKNIPYIESFFSTHLNLALLNFRNKLINNLILNKNNSLFKDKINNILFNRIKLNKYKKDIKFIKKNNFVKLPNYKKLGKLASLFNKNKKLISYLHYKLKKLKFKNKKFRIKYGFKYKFYNLLKIYFFKLKYKTLKRIKLPYKTFIFFKPRKKNQISNRNKYKILVKKR
jgi:hypothetical protein